MHSQYDREVRDVPCCGTRVLVHPHTRRFVCRSPGRQTLWWPPRRTERLHLQLVGADFDLGGEGRAWRGPAAGTPVSAPTSDTTRERSTASGCMRAGGLEEGRWVRLAPSRRQSAREEQSHGSQAVEGVGQGLLHGQGRPGDAGGGERLLAQRLGRAGDEWLVGRALGG